MKVQLDLSKPMFMRGQGCKLITATEDGRFVFQGEKGRVAVTDRNGCLPDGKTAVYNRKPRNVLELNPGDKIYRLARGERMLVARGTVVRVDGLKAFVAVEGKRSKKDPEGFYTWYLPYVFRSLDELDQYVERVKEAADGLRPKAVVNGASRTVLRQSSVTL